MSANKISRAKVTKDAKACSICGDAEPVHAHNGKERIEDYFTVGRGQSDFEAAKFWKRRYLELKKQIRRELDADVCLNSEDLVK
jgi:hypothetical protein